MNMGIFVQYNAFFYITVIELSFVVCKVAINIREGIR